MINCYTEDALTSDSINLITNHAYARYLFIKKTFVELFFIVNTQNLLKKCDKYK
jgi:hypothetical protein